jgi:hypothetical protein
VACGGPFFLSPPVGYCAACGIRREHDIEAAAGFEGVRWPAQTGLPRPDIAGRRANPGPLDHEARPHA